jgi:cytoskeletal protein CcmA (bactofilin family)
VDQNRGAWVRKKIGLDLPDAAREPEARDEAPEAALQSFIGEGAQFEGTLRIRGAFRIDTEFRGEIVSDTAVIVGEAAGIEANITSREVVIAGAVVGDVKAARQLSLRAGGRLTGDIETPCLEIEKGAMHNGRTSMVRPEAALRAGEERRAGAMPTAPPPAPVV